MILRISKKSLKRVSDSSNSLDFDSYLEKSIESFDRMSVFEKSTLSILAIIILTIFFCFVKVFGISNYLRLVLTAPIDKTREACERILQFCLDHERLIDGRALARVSSVTRAVGDEGRFKREESILAYHEISDKYK